MTKYWPAKVESGVGEKLKGRQVKLLCTDRNRPAHDKIHGYSWIETDGKRYEEELHGLHDDSLTKRHPYNVVVKDGKRHNCPECHGEYLIILGFGPRASIRKEDETKIIEYRWKGLRWLKKIIVRERRI